MYCYYLCKMDVNGWLLMLMFTVAVLYATVGHGGASGYIAVLSLFSFTPEVIRPLALFLNIGVSIIAFYRYYRSGNFRWTLFYPFIISSVPFAFLGAKLQLGTHVFHVLLGLLLIFPVINLLGMIPEKTNKSSLKIFPALVVGALIGLLSGLIGIGGGILLSPVLLLMGWASIKESAAVSSLFIFVNSVVVLFSLNNAASVDISSLWPIPVVVLSGGLIGAQFGAFSAHQKVLKGMLAAVLLIASVKLVFVQ